MSLRLTDVCAGAEDGCYRSRRSAWDGTGLDTPSGTLHYMAVEPPRRTRPRDRKASILRAAAESFAARGYHETSMADIAARLDISSAALYRHFAGKQDLLGQTLLSGLDSTLARLDVARGSAFDELVDTALDFRGLPRLWQREARNLAAHDRTAVLARVLRLCLPLRREVAARRPDLSRPNVEFLAWCALSVAMSPSHHAMRVPRSVFTVHLRAMIDDVVAAPLRRFPGNRPSSAQHWTHAVLTGPLERELRRERLVVAAAELFATRGYAAVAMEDIGAAAGITGPSVYHHFAGKAEVLAEVLDRSEQWIRLSTARALTVGATPEQTSTLLLDSYVQFAVEQTAFAATSVTEADQLPGAQGKQFRTAVRDGIIRWSLLLHVARPDLDLDAARIRIQAVTTIVLDAVRNDRIAHRRDLAAALRIATGAGTLGHQPTIG